MKKTFLSLLALILCLAFALTGCFANNIEENDDVAEENKNNSNVNTTNKDLLKDLFTKDETVKDNPLASLEFDPQELLDFIASISMKGDVTVTLPEQGTAKAEAAIQNNKLLCTLYNPDGSVADAYYFKLNDKIVEGYENYAGEGWESLGDPIDISEYLAMLDPSNAPEGGEVMPGMPAMPDLGNVDLSAFVMPELKDEYLTEKNGMIVISNDYFFEIFSANIDLLADSFDIPKADLEEAKTEIKEMVEQLGLEISFATGADTITKIAVSAKPTSEELDFFKEAYFAASSTPDASNLKEIEFKLVTPYSDYDIDYDVTISAKLETIIADNNIVGFKANVDFTVPGTGAYESFEPEAGSTEYKYEEEVTFQKLKFTATVDMSKLGTANADVVDVDLDLSVVKAFKVKGVVNYMTGEDKVESITEINASDFADQSVSASVNVKSVSENAVTADVTVKAAGQTITVKGNLLVGEFTFPEVPAEIK